MSKDTQPKKPINRNHPSIVLTEKKKQYRILLSLVIVIVIAVAFAGYGAYDVAVKPWGQQVLKINDTELTMKEYVARARYALESQGVTDPAGYQYLSSALPQITTSVINDTLMTDAAVTEYKVTVTADQITEQLKKDVLPASGEGDFDSLYKARLKEYNMTDAEYREMIRIKLVKTALVEDLNKEAPTTALQAHVLVITVASLDDANAIKARLDNGEDFATVAKEKSIDSLGATGGDAGWFPQGVLSDNFDTAIFALNPGEASAPVSSSDGTYYYIFKVTEKEDNKVLDATNLSAMQSKYVQDWLDSRNASAIVTNDLTAEKYSWVSAHI